jgi:hypothetical protein
MPFTALHLGPALVVGLPFRKWMHLPTFLLANVVLDIEPLIVLLFGLNYPVHGYLHTFLSATIIGFLLGFAMFNLEQPMRGIYLKTQLETKKVLPLRAFLIAGIGGTALHVLFDALIYVEMNPFSPLVGNPFLSFHLSSLSVYLLCFWLCIFGVACYFLLIAYSKLKRKVTLKTQSPPEV